MSYALRKRQQGFKVLHIAEKFLIVHLLQKERKGIKKPNKNIFFQDHDPLDFK